MKKLPFKTQPQQATKTVGDAETGVLEFPIYGGLKVGEQIAIDEAIAPYPQAFAEAARLAVKIDAELELNDLLFAFDIVANPAWEAEANASEALIQVFRSARIRYAPEIMALNNNSQAAGKAKQLAAVTAVIRHRLDDSWTVEDTSGLTDALFWKIWEFAREEMDDLEAAPLSAEDVGKHPVENSPQNDLTGQSSTGESNITGETTPDSQKSAS